MQISRVKPGNQRESGRDGGRKGGIIPKVHTVVHVNNVNMMFKEPWVMPVEGMPWDQCRINVARGPWHILSAGHLRRGLATFATSTGAKETVGSKR